MLGKGGVLMRSGRGSKLSTIRNGRAAAPGRARLWLSRLSVQHGRSASSHRSALRLRGVPWLRTALCSVCSPLQPFGPPMFASSLAALPASLGSSTAIAATGCAVSFALHWAYYGLFPPQAAAFVRPLWDKGSLLVSGTIVGSSPAKSLLFPAGKREVARRKP